MKKLFLAVFALMMLNMSSYSQTHPKKAKSDSSKMATKSGVVMKKDGTPDKRYKQAPAGPLKKDGTPDKRYKANKK